MEQATQEAERESSQAMEPSLERTSRACFDCGSSVKNFKVYCRLTPNSVRLVLVRNLTNKSLRDGQVGKTRKIFTVEKGYQGKMYWNGERNNLR